MMNEESGVLKLVFEMPNLDGASEVGVTLHRKGSTDARKSAIATIAR
jgi:hypothetical protein